MRHGRGFPSKVIIKQTNRIYFLNLLFQETMIGIDTVNKSIARLLTEGMIGVDTIAKVKVAIITLTEALIGVDSLRLLINGSATVWTKFTRNVSTWTPFTRD